MCNFKKLLSCLLVLAMLGSVAVMTSAETESSVFNDEILHSITTEDKTGLGLAFKFTANVSGAAKDGNYAATDYGTATVDGVTYDVVTMGAIMANRAEDIANIDNLTITDNVDDVNVLNVKAQKLYETDEATCSFIVRITHLPEKALGRAIAARPYIVLKDANGDETTLYGASDICTYNTVYYEHNEAEIPVLTAGAPDLDGKISITAASAEYAAYDPATYVEAFKVTATLSNSTTNAKTSVGDTVVCSFKDADGNELGTATLAVDVIAAGESKEGVEFYAPIGTATITATELNLNYVPDIIMPAIGSDIDVTKKKNRIRVSATEASFNEDGTIHVVWTFKNYTSNWITEETDYIKYTYYKGDTIKGTKTMYIGVIDTKKHPVKTYEFDVPAYVTKVTISSSKITYWTEWS